MPTLHPLLRPPLIPPIVLVPGLLCSAEIFAPQLAALWPHGPVTIASTLTGSTMREIAQSILDTAPPRFALAGISMGGYVCFEILRQAPARVLRLALLDTQARPDTAEQSAGRRALLEQAAGNFEAVAVAGLTAVLHPARRNDPALCAINERMARAVGLDGFARQTEALVTRVDSRPLLASIAVPTLVLVGDSDAVTPPDRAEEMSSVIPDARLVVVPECGHGSTIEQPEAVNDALLHWIAR